MPEDHTHHRLCVPVREGACGSVLRMFRDRDGSRCAVAFSSEERLRAVLGEEQHWLPLAEPALRALAAPLGVATLILDPNLIAPTVRNTPAATPAPALPAAPLPVAAPVLAAAAATVAVGAADLLLQLLS
ncbi:SAV_915 family protein [Streptacidiphilus sp. P02-A3a]|uniref:SAV_915 family protein n=1 Tax=Streptacidiphilus sp. P02-A3a TaxID=2704468 RepID=UPI0015FC29B2|nr:SAV_915 family protein [Streptacidiphilus sp. P02-A3a]QMU73343.1 SseB family protein [Streptacidiphilus sp. P02-A3a]